MGVLAFRKMTISSCCPTNSSCVSLDSSCCPANSSCVSLDSSCCPMDSSRQTMTVFHRTTVLSTQTGCLADADVAGVRTECGADVMAGVWHAYRGLGTRNRLIIVPAPARLLQAIRRHHGHYCGSAASPRFSRGTSRRIRTGCEAALDGLLPLAAVENRGVIAVGLGHFDMCRRAGGSSSKSFSRCGGRSILSSGKRS